jgi:hypothetical protein
VALLERRIREHLNDASRAPKPTPKPQAAQLAKKQAEIGQLRAAFAESSVRHTSSQLSLCPMMCHARYQMI